MVSILNRKKKATYGIRMTNSSTGYGTTQEQDEQQKQQKQMNSSIFTIGSYRITVVHVFILSICIIFVVTIILLQVPCSTISCYQDLNMILVGGTSTTTTITASANDHTENIVRCQYDGHCPVQYTCSVPIDQQILKTTKNNDYNEEGYVGVCELISLNLLDTNQKQQQQQQSSSTFDKCVQTCEKELILDEHYYNERAITIKSKHTIQSLGRPNGCLLTFIRLSGRDTDLTNQLNQLDIDNLHSPTEQPEQIQRWIDQRFRYIIRTDPVLEKNAINENLWFTYCWNECQSDQDCITTNENNNKNNSSSNERVTGFVCIKGTCQRNEKYWNTNNNATVKERSKMVLVTGATASYMGGLLNLLASALYWAPNNLVVVYNLGALDKNMITEIQSYKNVLSVEWINGIPPIPDKNNTRHVHTPQGYAWKPIIINETVHKYKQIFWLDAGNTLTGPITAVEKIVHRTGSYLVKGQDSEMYSMSNPLTYTYLGFNKETFISGPHFSGNTQAYMYPSRYIDSIVIPMTVCAINEECIMPSGHHLRSHRYDQTVLSILAYNLSVHAPHYTEYLAATSAQVNKPPILSTRFVWTARQGCLDYTTLYKSGNIP